MKINLPAVCLSAVLALAGSAITPAMADEWNKETRLQITEPLEIPGKVLQPGTYIFKLADSQTERNVVQVYSVDAKGNQHFVTTVLAVSAYSMETPGKPVIALEERAASAPQAIHKWFYPGDNYGWEFVYPKSERLAVSASAAVPAEQPAAVETPSLPDPPVEASVPEIPAEPEIIEQADSQPVETLVVASEVTEYLLSADRMLPETAGNAAAQLAAGIAILALGLMAVVAGVRKAEA